MAAGTEISFQQRFKFVSGGAGLSYFISYFLVAPNRAKTLLHLLEVALMDKRIAVEHVKR